MDDIARARAILGVAPGVSPDELRRRYKALVRQWHPDRHSQDAASEAEAALKMRQINDAYHRLLAHLAPAVRHAERPAARSQETAGRRLSREEIERLVASIGTKGPIDDLLDSLPQRAGGGYSEFSIFATLFAVALMVTHEIAGGSLAVPLIFTILGVGILVWHRGRRRR